MTHTLVAPACVAGVSAILGLRSVLLSSKRAPASPQTQTTETRYGAIFAWNILRLFGCFALFGLSVASLAIHFEEHDLLYVRLCMCITFAYATILAAFAALGFLKHASHHLTFLLVVTFGIYAYRDIYPLGTFDKSPVDLSEGDLLWPMICVLGVTGIVIPLFTPRTYTPFDPEFPSPKPSSEQTASPLGLALWTFLDPIILLANRVSHLAFDQLPPLADSDEARNLAKKAFPMRTLVHTESIITQLVFEHALRIRMKSEASESLELASENAPTPSTPSTPDSASIADSTLADSTTTAGTATSAGKGKQKAQSEDTASVSSAKSTGKTTPQRPQENLIGRINNLVSTDLGNITDARNWLWLILYIPLQVALCMTFLYRVLGWSSFVGIAMIIICFPMPGYVAKLMQSSQKKKMQTTDDRIQNVTETLGVLRMIKLFGWEGKMNERLRDTRDKELHWTRKIRVFQIINTNINFCMPASVFSESSAEINPVSTASHHDRNVCDVHCDYEKGVDSVYGSMAAFDILRGQIFMGFQFLPACLQGQVSLDRLNTFLNDTELLDAYAEGSSSTDVQVAGMGPEDDDAIGFSNAKFSWSGSSSDGTMTPSKRQFLLQLDGKVFFKRGALNMVVGPTGSGKTSLLMALLGEMHFIRAGPLSWFNLPREGGIAYAAQESWVKNETIKNNILFGAPYDEARYKKGDLTHIRMANPISDLLRSALYPVLYQCALMRDLELFDAGDETEVGEKGLTLSGGQKVLAALDVHTSKWIVDKCFLGDLIKGRTVILVTHNIAMIGPIAQFVLSLGTDGRIVSQGTISEALVHDETLAKEEASETEIMAKADTEIDPDIEKTKPDGTLIVAENIAEGRITWETLKAFFLKTGGEHPFLFWAVYLGLAFGGAFTDSFGPWWLGVWASQYETHHSSEVSVLYYMVMYTAGLLLDAAL
ncbi:hypothetical protein HWV62_37249 [Athelia sp. TMB]|nr:hypothetical protein HWV62_37249 [Athelia sp. TMB]